MTINTGHVRLITKPNGNIGDIFLDDFTAGGSGSSGGTFLPNVGPFAAFAPVDVTSLSNRTVSSSIEETSSTESVPLKYNVLTINTNVALTNMFGTNDMFLQVNIVNLANSSSINIQSQPGFSGGDNFPEGADGIPGNSGSGGGAAYTPKEVIPGPRGGDGGSDGSDGTAGETGEARGGFAGVGSHITYSYPSYGTGGNGADGPNGAVGGAGANGKGGAGAGGGGYGVSGGSGAAAPGVFVLVANSIVCTGTHGPNFIADGNVGGQDSMFGDYAGGSGGGIVWIATRHWSGAGSARALAGDANSGPGQVFLFQINSDDSLTARSFGDQF